MNNRRSASAVGAGAGKIVLVLARQIGRSAGGFFEGGDVRRRRLGRAG